MKKLTRIVLAVAILVVSGIAATNASAARGVPLATFGHNFSGGRYFPPNAIRRYFPPNPIRRHARVIPAHPPQVNPNNYKGPPGPSVPCPPGQFWEYFPAIQGYMCAPMGHGIPTR